MAMQIMNVHERRLGPAIDPEAVRAVVRRVALPDGGFWPSDRWPPMRLDRGMVPGAAGGHGSIRYSVEAVEPDTVTFRFDRAIGVDGVHRFEIDRRGDGIVVRHTIDARAHGAMAVLWPTVIEPLHDALIEDALDGLEATLAGVPIVRVEHDPVVRRRLRLLAWMQALDRDRAGRARTAAASSTGVVLGGVGLLHAAWAAGVTTWPGRDRRALARVVVGGETFPSSAATFAVAGLCVLAGTSVAARGRPAQGTRRALSQVASRIVAVVLALRGMGGLVTSGLGLGSATATFRRNDLLVYSPLCLALAAGAFVASSPAAIDTAGRRVASDAGDPARAR
jgi:hypothetical protein